MTHTKDEALISLITELVGIVALYDMEKARRLGKRVHQALAAPAPVQEPVQNLYGWKFYQGCYVMHPEVLQAVIDEAIKQARSAPTVQEPVAYTTGHCIEKAKPGGCPLHNLHCKFPACDRKES